MTVESRNMPSKPQSSPDSRSDTSEASEERIEDICRDFLRNVCKRGRRCKYRHPPAHEARELGKRQEFTFCHDFQNSGCRRANCRFIHCTREEEDYYKQTGQLPVRLQQAAALGIGVVPNELPLLKGEVPICKDNLKGGCKRGNRCKYRHISSAEYHAYEASRTPVLEPNVAATPTATVTNGVYTATSYTEDFNGLDYETASKRRKLDPAATVQAAAAAAAPAAAAPPTFDLTQPPPPIPDATTVHNPFTVPETNNNQFLHPPPTANGALTVPPPTYRILRTPADYRLMEEENVVLRRKVEELKKQVSDLAATNEVLLEQNARYRSSKVTAVNAGPPVVSVSQVVTPTITCAPAVARSLHTPTAQIGPPLTTLSQISLQSAKSEFIMSQALHSAARLANDLTQTASMATAAACLNIVPVSNSLDLLQAAGPQAVSQGVTQMVAPISQGVTQMAPVSSMPQTATMEQTSLPPPTLVSGPSTHLVSYPIMSHSITQIPNSSLTQITNPSLTQHPTSSLG